ncbi:MAG: hypothetical protein ACRDA8_10255 [Shewanella sp.]
MLVLVLQCRYWQVSKAFALALKLVIAADFAIWVGHLPQGGESP